MPYTWCRSIALEHSFLASLRMTRSDKICMRYAIITSRVLCTECNCHDSHHHSPLTLSTGRSGPGPAYFYWPLALALEGWAEPAGPWPRASSTRGHEGRARAGPGPARGHQDPLLFYRSLRHSVHKSAAFLSPGPIRPGPQHLESCSGGFSAPLSPSTCHFAVAHLPSTSR